MRLRLPMTVAVGLLVLAGCSGGGDTAAESGPQASSATPLAESASPTASSSPTNTQSAEDKKIAKGKEAIRLFDQTIVDIYASPTPRIDDMHGVAFGTALENAMRGLAEGVQKGWSTTPGVVEVVWVEPVSIEKTKLVLFACVDRSDVRGGFVGDDKKPYERAAIDYWIEKIEDRWLPTRLVAHGDENQAVPC